jgi:hypothetical protein
MASCDDVMATRRHPLGVGRRMLGISNHSLGVRRRPLGVRLQALGVPPRTLGLSNLPLGEIEKSISAKGLRPDRKSWFSTELRAPRRRPSPSSDLSRAGPRKPSNMPFPIECFESRRNGGSRDRRDGGRTRLRSCGIGVDRGSTRSFRRPGMSGGRQVRGVSGRTALRRSKEWLDARARWSMAFVSGRAPEASVGSRIIRVSSFRSSISFEDRRAVALSGVADRRRLAIGPLGERTRWTTASAQGKIEFT